MKTATNFWVCWRCEATNDSTDPHCEGCGAERKTSPETATRRCAGCDSTSNLNVFHADGAEQDRGKLYCASCWIGALRRRADLDPISADERRRCIAAIGRLETRFPSVRGGMA